MLIPIPPRQTACIVLATLALLLITPSALGETFTATIGEKVELNGTVPIEEMVYLYVTGPNLHTNGVRMDNIKQRVYTGNPLTFTQVPVENDSWHYSWNTAKVSGSLAEGHYVVYVVTKPVGKEDLNSSVKYATKEVILKYGGMDPPQTTPVSSPQTTTQLPISTPIETLATPLVSTTLSSPTPSLPPSTTATPLPAPLVGCALAIASLFMLTGKGRIG
ncbi:MAG: hypothetical protein NT074_08925 [Methanomicrobiales archaeon]|nr:hypothetical protein [Methanomicrobiales archaeon]